MATAYETTARDDSYFRLVRAFPLRPIRDDSGLGRAIELINSLLDRDDLDPGEEDYLDVLGDLVRQYESAHHSLPVASPTDVLRHLLDARGETQSSLASATGIAESTISAILSGRRGLNLKHVTALARHFHVSPAVFLVP